MSDSANDFRMEVRRPIHRADDGRVDIQQVHQQISVMAFNVKVQPPTSDPALRRLQTDARC
jgi:hypothetical protein